jgi:purine nucleoside permease
MVPVHLRTAVFALLISAASHAFAAPRATAAKPIPVKVVIVTMFEVGEDTGDRPGELQNWVERDHLDRVYPMAGAYHAVRMNDRGEMAVLTGPGTAHAAANIMAVGLDPRFDFSHAYWIVAGIAGGNPAEVSLGSAAWARWVVDTDLSYEIDAREIPKDWHTGRIPFRKSHPYETPAAPLEGQVFHLNEPLVDWAYGLSRTVRLADSPAMAKNRSEFDGAAANKPPFVAIGDEVSGATFWHGRLQDQWAGEWMRYFTDGKGTFATTGMEDTGTLLSLRWLANAGRVDFNRILVLRTVSNYDQPPRGVTAAENLERQRIGTYSGFLPALEAAYQVGHTVANELLTNWPKYERMAPGTAK